MAASAARSTSRRALSLVRAPSFPLLAHLWADEQLVVEHEPGSVLLHLGRHRHQALELSAGHRINLILWCRSSRLRSAASYMACAPYCGLHPSNVQRIHDRYCSCGHFEQHGQGVAFEEVSDEDEDDAVLSEHEH